MSHDPRLMRSRLGRLCRQQHLQRAANRSVFELAICWVRRLTHEFREIKARNQWRTKCDLGLMPYFAR